MADARALLIDIDGVLTVSWEPLDGAVDALHRIRAAQLPFVLVTNTTSRTRNEIAGTLAEVGFPVEPAEVLTAPAATAEHLRTHHPGARVALLSSGEVAADLGDVRFVELSGRADVVVLGGAGPEFTYEALDDVFARLQEGATLLAMHRNLYWRTSSGLQLDTGAFLAGLEEAAGVEATVLGKPSEAFFAAALSRLGVEAAEALMIGDDVEADVLGAQAVGIAGVLVRTGKFRPEAEEGAGGERPQRVVDSFADLPELLRL